MKIFRTILLIGIPFLFNDLFGQELRILNTKDLLGISKEIGLDSALSLTSGNPIYYLDSLTPKELVRQIEKYEPSDRIERFLIDYSYHSKFSELPEIIYRFYEKKLNQINSYEPQYESLPEILNDALITMLEKPTNETVSLLIKYYQSWLIKSEQYYPNYLKGLKEDNSRRKERLMTPFQDCNLNCYKILLALDSLKSEFFDSIKLEKHNKFLKEYNKNMFLYKSDDFSNYNYQVAFDTLSLERSYNSLGELNFEKEPALKKLQKRYSESFCWKLLMYNETLGYLDFGCQWDPLAGYGVLYRIELLGKNKLKITTITTWIS